MARKRLIIRGTAAQAGLATAGHQAGIPEHMFWDMTNYIGDLDGLLVKAPGLNQHGQTIKRPDTSDTTAFVSFLNGLDGFVSADSSDEEINLTTSKGVLQAAVSVADGKTYTLSYMTSALPSGTDWALRFLFQGINLPAYADGDVATVPESMSFRVRASSTSGKEFAFFSDGLYYKKDADSEYALVTGSAYASLGGWNTIEILGDSAGNVLVYMNETLLQTLTASDLKQATFTEALAIFEFKWETSPDGAYTTKITTPMYSDTDSDPWTTDPIDAIGEFQYFTRAGTRKRALLAACGDYIYHDTHLVNVWRPLHTKQHQYVHFAPYRQTIVWTNHNGASSTALWQWNGTDDAPTLLDDAPPLHVVAEHQQRLCGIGDPLNPFRWYYSGDRQPNVWFSSAPDNVEDQFDTALDAGYLEIPAKKGDRLTAMYGDFYDNAVVWSTRGAWRITGYGVFSYRPSNIARSEGCEGPWALTEVGNDIWYVGPNGIRSLVAVQEYGDIQSQQPAVVLQNLWARNGRSELLINRNSADRSILQYSPSQQLVYIAVPLQGNTTPMHEFAYNVNTGQMYGPMEFDSRAMLCAERSNPLTEVMLHGDAEGRVGYTSHNKKSDLDGAQYTSKLQSALLDGRSIDPRLSHMVKTWYKLRLQILPRGKWPFTVSWYSCSSDEWPELGTSTEKQGRVFKAYPIGTGVEGEFRLNAKPDSLLRSGEDVLNYEIELDGGRGVALWWKIESDYDLPISSWEVELDADGYEEE